jgi:hypothetical protein
VENILLSKEIEIDRKKYTEISLYDKNENLPKNNFKSVATRIKSKKDDNNNDSGYKKSGVKKKIDIQPEGFIDIIGHFDIILNNLIILSVCR